MLATKPSNMISLSLILLISACAPLSKSQLKASHNYLEAITNQPRYFRELNTQVANLSLEMDNLRSSLEVTDSARIWTIINSINDFEEFLELPDSLLAHIKYLEGYSQHYYSLIPNGFNIYKTLKGTTATIGGFFGFGGVAGLLPSSNLNQINPTKKRKIRNHILSSEKDLLVSLNHIRRFILNHYIPRLDVLHEESKVKFEALLASINHSAQPLEYYTIHNRMLTDFYQQLFLAKGMAEQLIKAIDSSIMVEKKLTRSFQEPERIELEKTGLNELAFEVQRLNHFLSELNQKRSVE